MIFTRTKEDAQIKVAKSASKIAKARVDLKAEMFFIMMAIIPQMYRDKNDLSLCWATLFAWFIIGHQQVGLMSVFEIGIVRHLI